MTRLAAALLTALAAASLAPHVDQPDEWPYYGHDAGGARYSPLADISRSNVAQLKVAWTFHTGDVRDEGGNRRTGFESTPIVVDGTLFVTTGLNRIIALDPETGAQRWAYDPKIDPSLGYGDGLINRGVATWRDGSRGSGAPCARRLFEATLDARLVAVDAANGMPCGDFGERGQVRLADVPGYRPGVYHMSSPPAVVDNDVVVGSAIDDNGRVDMPSGVVRAFDVRTGALRWKWDPIPRSESAGAANAWSIMSVDPDRHLVFVPTGSASPDYFGGLRPGDDKWANSIVALHADTGKVAWGFQLVHHDLWDYDSAAAPLLATINRGGRRVPVAVQGNKTGFLYVLDRDTGAPVFGIEERSVPASDVDGERASPTQPFPLAPPPVARQRLSADDAWGVTPQDREACRASMAALRNDGLFTPPSLRGTLVFPGNLGGMNWSGSAFDPDRNLLIVNSNNLAANVRLIPREAFADAARANDGFELAPQIGAPVALARRFLQAPSGLPCTPPPWGHLTAVDLDRGTIRWQVPLGSMSAFTGGRVALPDGSISLGGPITTAGGLIFVAGTLDARLHAFDVETGKELWSGELPVTGNATPIAYKVKPGGRQFVVIAAGGHAKISELKLGDALVAFALPSNETQANEGPRNDLPQPYRTTRDWGELPPGVKWAAVTAVEPAPDGTIYVVHRCFANSCAGRPEAPILKYDASGRLLKAFGEGLFVFPHGATVDGDGNLWVTDARGEAGKGHQVFKFAPDGRILMTLGQKGVSGSTPGLFDQPTDVVVSPAGDIFVTDSHRNGKNNRVVRFTKDGKYVKEWGHKGSGRGELSEPHTIAMDSRGRLFVGDRENNRIQIFDQDGNYVDEWRQFGRPSGIFITKDDTIYVADSESGPDTGAHELTGIRKGIRIGSARDGRVFAFIEDAESTAPDHSGAEGVGVDAQGNVYGAVVRRQMLERHVRITVGRPF